MKKIIPILLTLGLLTLLLQFIINLFISHHKTTYYLKTKDNTYEIMEEFAIKDNDSLYDFTIKDKDKSFYTFSLNKDLNKQDKIIRDIKYFSTKDLKCIFPIYKRKISSDVSCIYKGEQVSYSYLKQINNQSIKKITSKIKKMGYDNPYWKDKNLTKKSIDNRLNVYQNNILSDYIFTIWNYKGIYILKNDKIINKQLLEKDQYENINSTLVDKYYIYTGDTDITTAISDLFYYNIKDSGKGAIPLETPLSLDYYFNGVYDNKLYITDLQTEKQYSIDPTTKKEQEVGNSNDGYKVLKNKNLVTIPKSDFIDKKVYFSNNIINKKITKKYQESEIKEENDNYYFKTKDGKIYFSPKDNETKSKLLFQLPNITEWKVHNNDILVVSDDTVYFYNELSGLSPIAVSHELKYNFKNICDFMKK